MKIVSRKGGSKDVLDFPLFSKEGVSDRPLDHPSEYPRHGPHIKPWVGYAIDIYILPDLYNTKSKKFYDCQICFKNRWYIQQKITFWQPTLDGCQIIDLFVVYQWYIIDFLSLVWQFNFCCRISYFLGILEIKVYAVFCGHSLWELFSNNLI